ncbi:MAG: SEC-C metal-binding domain-containing protein [Myxococcales bacterium]|nr:SEC-C metal-binding domain-containing protein [Myxococcales bacterium]
MALIPYDKVPGERDPPLLLEGQPVRELYCGDPRCDCLTGHLLAGGTALAVDVGTGRLDFLDSQTAMAMEPLREQMRRLLRGEGVLERLRAHYQAVRAYGLDHHHEHVDWTHLQPGQLVPWTAVFPREGIEMLPVLKEIRPPPEGRQAPEYTDEDVAFRLGLGDHYCVDARCDCQRVLWEVYAMAPTDRDQVRPLGTVSYDFRKRVPAVDRAAPGVDPDQLLYTVLATLSCFPGLVEEHARRYQRIRQILIPLIQRQRRQQEAERAALLRAVGRNDPCPCGSGKKYKKCHGA